MAQALEIIGGRLANGRIQVAFTLAGGQHVLQAEAVDVLAWQAINVGQRVQVLAGQRADQSPGLVNVLVNLIPMKTSTRLFGLLKTKFSVGNSYSTSIEFEQLMRKTHLSH